MERRRKKTKYTDTESHKHDIREKKESFRKQMIIAYHSLEDQKKYIRTILIPCLVLAGLLFSLPFILANILLPQIRFNPLTFILAGTVPMFLGLLYPFVTWKNKESNINGKMHFFITHLRVLAISDLSLREIITTIGGKKAYASLGEEMRKIGVLSTQWRTPLSRSFKFISERTPSKILKDFLDRFSQSLDSGVEHREFIETEQEAVLQEYKTMYETSNENIVILNEVYVSMLIAIIFVMSLGIVLPIIIGAQDMNMFIYLSSFLLIVVEGMLLYLLQAMVPPDEIWHQTGEKGEIEQNLNRSFKYAIAVTVLLASAFLFARFVMRIPFIQMIPFEIAIAITLSPLIIPGIKTFLEEENITRKDRNFLGFLPSLGSISAMRGGKINDSVYYLSQKDYGLLTKHIRSLYRRLRTRIDDDAAWEWFGVDTGSNYIQRASEMFRESTYAAANPRHASRMIAENIRKIRDLRIKKLTIINTSIALFAGITFGISFAIYVSLIIGRHLNEIMIETGNPFEDMQQINMGALLHTVPPEVYNNNFIIIFTVLVVHCFMMAITIKTLRGSHKYLTLLYFVPFVWVVAITSFGVELALGGYLGM